MYVNNSEEYMPVTVMVIIRSSVGFFLLLFFVKLIGKQQMEHITYFDYIVGITIGSIASTLSVQVNENAWSTMTGMAVWTLLAVLLAVISVKNTALRKIVEGIPEIVIQNGKVQIDVLRKNKVSFEDLMSMLRVKGAFRVDDVEFAVFE
jgi:uncharacterized membrane protein YcaP (DUF421 family)